MYGVCRSDGRALPVRVCFMRHGTTQFDNFVHNAHTKGKQNLAQGETRAPSVLRVLVACITRDQASMVALVILICG